jgi:hypothetical protein
MAAPDVIFGEGAVSTVELALCLQIGVCTMPRRPLSSQWPEVMPELEENTDKLIEFLGDVRRALIH